MKNYLLVFYVYFHPHWNVIILIVLLLYWFHLSTITSYHVS
jgi:hypothetical protein